MTQTLTTKVLIIGAGTGGYVAGIRCGQLGLDTILVDGGDGLGGTCLNVGCIPSKALLDSSHHFHNVTHLFPQHGIKVTDASIDLATLMARKDKVVQNLTRGIAGLFRKNKVKLISGTATLGAEHVVTVQQLDGANIEVRGGAIIIATGSVPFDIPVATVDGQRIVDNEGALAFTEVPQRLGIIGAGVIGLELGSVWKRLGAEVTVLEALDSFLPGADTAIASEALKVLKRQGLDIRLGCRVTTARAGDDSVAVHYEDQGGNHSLEVDKLVVAVGRRAYADGLVADGVELELDDRGRVVVDVNA